MYLRASVVAMSTCGAISSARPFFFLSPNVSCTVLVSCSRHRPCRCCAQSSYMFSVVWFLFALCVSGPTQHSNHSDCSSLLSLLAYWCVPCFCCTVKCSVKHWMFMCPLSHDFRKVNKNKLKCWYIVATQNWYSASPITKRLEALSCLCWCMQWCLCECSGGTVKVTEYF